MCYNFIDKNVSKATESKHPESSILKTKSMPKEGQIGFHGLEFGKKDGSPTLSQMGSGHPFSSIALEHSNKSMHPASLKHCMDVFSKQQRLQMIGKNTNVNFKMLLCL